MTLFGVRTVLLNDGGGSLIVYRTGSGSLTILDDLKSESRGNSIQNLMETFSKEVIDIKTVSSVDFQSTIQTALPRAKQIAAELYDKMKSDTEEMQQIDTDISGTTKVQWQETGNGGR